MSPLVHYRRYLGTFSIPFELINGEPKQAQAILLKCIVLGCKRDNEWGCVSYLAANEQFDVVKIDEAVPYYIYTIEFKDGRFHRKWLRAEAPARITLPT